MVCELRYRSPAIRAGGEPAEGLSGCWVRPTDERGLRRLKCRADYTIRPDLPEARAPTSLAISSSARVSGRRAGSRPAALSTSRAPD